MKIIFVDDMPDTREIAKLSFESAGIEAITFERGADALAYLWRDGEGVDAVILDLAMPVEDGLTLARRIRANEKLYDKCPLPLYFFTAYPVNQAVIGYKEEVGAKHVFSKTDDPFEIVQRVRQTI